jgi:hypothetical protein
MAAEFGGLSSVNGVQIIEQDKVKDVYCLCMHRGEKQYTILDMEGRKLFVAQEHRDRCCPHCGCLLQRDFNLYGREAKSDKKIVKFRQHRQFCTCFAFMSCCRLKNTVTNLVKGKKIGSVGSACQCVSCYPKFYVWDKDGKKKFTVQQESHFWASFLCCGAERRRCCGIQCYVPSSLSVRDTKGNKESLEHLDGGRSIDADAYELKFTKGCSVDDKMLLIAAVINVDYKMYSGQAPGGEKMVDLSGDLIS